MVGSRRAQAPRPHARRLPSVYTYQYRCLTLRTCTMIPPNFHPELSGESRARAHAVSATTRPQTYPGGSPRADLHAKKGNNLVPMAPRPRQIRNYPRAPSSRHSGLVGPHTTPPIVNYKYMTSTPREGYFGAAHARDVNIFIWTSLKSVDHETNDRVMGHGDGTRAGGRRFGSGAQMNQIVGSRDRRGARSISVGRPREGRALPRRL